MALGQLDFRGRLQHRQRPAAARNAFRILAIRPSHLILESLATRNHKRFDQTFGKHSSRGPECSLSRARRNNSVASTNNRQSEMRRCDGGRRMDHSCFATACAAEFAGLHTSGRLLRQPLHRIVLSFSANSFSSPYLIYP